MRAWKSRIQLEIASRARSSSPARRRPRRSSRATSLVKGSAGNTATTTANNAASSGRALPGAGHADPARRCRAESRHPPPEVIECSSLFDTITRATGSTAIRAPPVGVGWLRPASSLCTSIAVRRHRALDRDAGASSPDFSSADRSFGGARLRPGAARRLVRGSPPHRVRDAHISRIAYVGRSTPCATPDFQ